MWIFMARSYPRPGGGFIGAEADPRARRAGRGRPMGEEGLEPSTGP